MAQYVYTMHGVGKIVPPKREILKALAALASSIWAPDGEVPVSFKRLVSYMASKAHGCNY